MKIFLQQFKKLFSNLFQNDRALDSLQNIKWYILSETQKKQYTFILRFAQNPSYLMAGVNVIGMELFVSVNNKQLVATLFNYILFPKVLKSVYSVTMLLFTTEMN